MNEIVSELAPRAIGPYAQAIVHDGWVFASGQLAIDPDTGSFVGGDVAAQTNLVLRNLAAVLNAAGASMGTVVKTTVYMTDLANFHAMNVVYAEHFGDHHPARATVQVAGLPADAAVEIDAVARVATP